MNDEIQKLNNMVERYNQRAEKWGYVRLWFDIKN